MRPCESSISVFFSYSHRDGMAGGLVSFVQRAVDACNVMNDIFSEVTALLQANH